MCLQYFMVKTTKLNIVPEMGKLSTSNVFVTLHDQIIHNSKQLGWPASNTKNKFYHVMKHIFWNGSRILNVKLAAPHLMLLTSIRVSTNYNSLLQKPMILNV